MKTLLRALKTLVIVLVILVLVVGAGGYVFVQRTLPQTDGTLTVDGLKAKVEIIRDKSGVPHIYAQSLDDLFFALAHRQLIRDLIEITAGLCPLAVKPTGGKT